jgi:hypothetical protein
MRGARRVLIACTVILAAMAIAPVPAAGPKFRSDDPLAREPETQDASKVEEWDIDLFVDLAINLFGRPGDDDTGVHAGNVNTIDEVPDSSWFTNRIGTRPVAVGDALRASSTGGGVAPGTWTVIAPKEAGFAPGFTIRDAAGETWFISFDARGYPEAATGAIIAATKIFWTLGYWQTDSVLTSIRPGEVSISEQALVKVPSGKRRPMRAGDLKSIWDRSQPSADGSYRAVASRRLRGRALGGFRYYGTRPDDPNDIVPHEHRRELRALQVFGAWTNLVDMKAGNTLDMLVTDEDPPRVRHYLQDVGSTFGTGANAPREYFEGYEHVYDHDLVWKRLFTLGFFLVPWQTIPYQETPAIGRFEGVRFDPVDWKPRVPPAALRHAQPDDLFWAARRVTAFSDDLIRAIVDSARFTRGSDARLLADTLIQRRDKIAASYLVAVTPLVDFTIAGDELTFTNAAAQAGVMQQRGGYEISWAYFDNAANSTSAIGNPSIVPGERAPVPALRESPGTYVRARIRVVDPPVAGWVPVDAIFRRDTGRWTLVGIDRTPQ